MKIAGFKNDSDCNDEHMSDSDEDDPDVIPSTIYTEVKASYDFLEKEKEKVDKKFENLENRYIECQKLCEELKEENNELVELRTLNRQLQQKLLDLAQGKYKGFVYFLIN